MAPLARTDQLEILDQLDQGVPARALDGNLRDIRRANRWFGGTRATLAAVAPAVRALSSDEPVTLLDIATGSADIPLALLDWAAREGHDLRVTATDLQPEVLATARMAAGRARAGALVIERADALALPYPDDAFDIVTCSQALHHFGPEGAAQALREARRVGRRALVVSDLERARLGYAGAWLFGNLLTRNRLTRHDAPLSVRRAYTPAEALALAGAAGWREPRVRRAVPFRYVLTGRP